MPVRFETKVTKKQIVTISLHAEERLRRRAIYFISGLLALVLGVLAILTVFETSPLPNRTLRTICGISLLLYLYWCSRSAKKVKEKVLRQFGWDGTYPVEMRVDYPTFLHD
jgi:putative Ca2+/H+ antiporter (TMEM165/GDT1 family)